MTIIIIRQEIGTKRCQTTLLSNVESRVGVDFLRRDLLIFRWWGGSADESGAGEETIKWVLLKRIIGKNGGKDEHPQTVSEK